MGDAKKLIVKPISSKDANRIIKRLHYSGKVVPNSQLHFGVFLDGKCGGAMQFGPSMRKDLIRPLVSDTGWNEFLELNRMAFADWLPRNGESRCIGYSMRYIKKHYPHIEWVISFADGCQCGDGTIYRASGFLLTSVKKNSTIIKLTDGSIASNITFSKGRHILSSGGAKMPEGAKRLAGFQLRYIYFLDPTAKDRLTVPVLPFSKIDEMGAGMYKGKQRIQKRASSDTIDTPDVQSGKGGVIPTDALHSSEDGDE